MTNLPLESKRRILKGIRPGGWLHLGLLNSAVKTCLGLQAAADTECMFFCADWHGSIVASDNDTIYQRRLQTMIDWLVAGFDPTRSTLFLQSAVPELAELLFLLGLITPLSWLESVPTYVEQLALVRDNDRNTIGLLSYPLLQAADILAYRPTHVPVGPQHLSHIELVNRLADRFDSRFGRVFNRIEPIVSVTHAVWEYGATCIHAGEDSDSTRRKIFSMAVDPARAKGEPVGHPEDCGIYHLHVAYSNHARCNEVEQGCRAATLACGTCKNMLLDVILPAQALFRERRVEIQRRPKDVMDVFEQGSKRARTTATATLESVREAMGLKWRHPSAVSSASGSPP